MNDISIDPELVVDEPGVLPLRIFQVRQTRSLLSEAQEGWDNALRADEYEAERDTDDPLESRF